MSIEVKNTVNTVDYEESMNILEQRVEDVLLGKKKELLWIIEHNSVYTAGTSSNENDLFSRPNDVVLRLEKDGSNIEFRFFEDSRLDT